MLLFRNNYPSWKTSTSGVYNFLFHVFSFNNMLVEMKKNISHSEKKFESFMLLINRNLNYTQFNCLNGIGDPFWSFMAVQHAPVWHIKILQFVWFMHKIILCGSMIFHFMWHNLFLFFYKFAGKDLGLLNIKSFKFKQYSLQIKTFGFHGCLIAKILNIFYIVSDARIVITVSYHDLEDYQ